MIPSVRMWAAVSALVVLGCTPAANSDAATRATELAARSLIAAWERADSALVEDLFWPQATYDDFPNQVTYQGLEEIVGYVTSAHVWGDDVYMNVGRVHVSDAHAIVEWVFSAVQNRPIPGLVDTITGHEVVLNGVTVLEFDGDRIIRAADYSDSAPLFLQLGSSIELPGDRVIRNDGGD